MRTHAPILCILLTLGPLVAACEEGPPEEGVIGEPAVESLGLRVACRPDDNPCTREYRRKGQCVSEPVLDGTPCPGGSCVAGACAPGPAPACGDRSCNGSETCSSCPGDCGVCIPVCGDRTCNGSETCTSCPGDCGSCGGAIDCANAATWPAAWSQFEDDVLALVNQQRAAGATCGTTVYPPVGPLAMNAALRQAARCHSLDMGTQGYFSHASLDGRSPWDRIAVAGYTGAPTAENIAAGYSTPGAVVAGWMGSSGHCANIMGAGSNETGVGYAWVSGSPYGHYWTETFGRL